VRGTKLFPAALRNYMRLLFTDPIVRNLHREWEHDARDAVAALRMEAAKDPTDSLTLDCDTWDSPDGSGQRLMVLTAEPGTPSYDALRILASWTTTATERPDPARADPPV
jgi:hypothetical protein